MERLTDNLIDIINNGENATVEFKQAKKNLPNNLFETICSMLNRNGGHIFLGVDDSGIIVGVYKDYIQNMKKNFVNMCNNREKIFPTVHLEIKEYEYNDKSILYIYVYESSDVHRTSNKIYDRNEDGDYDITNNTSLISQLYIRKSHTYVENKIFPYATMDNLRTDLIERVRKMAHNRDANHPWSTMNDIELLKSASLYDYDIETGKEGINLAGILLFGKDETIKSVLPYYKTDAILRIKDKDRYDDRDDIRTNLIESYDRLMNFINKHLDDRFFIEGDQRIDVRGKIARELCVNLLIHREFSNPIPARLIINEKYIETENANKPRKIGYIDLNNYIPYPKNPKIAFVFKEIGLADELGSGFKKIVKYTKIYSNGIPIFKDDDIFKVKIPLIDNNELMIKEEESKYISRYDEIKNTLYQFINNNSGVTRKEIDDYIFSVFSDMDKKIIKEKIRNIIDFLSKKRIIINLGTRKEPKWFIKKD